MRGEFWKFRMAAQFHELGYFQRFDPKARYLLWASAIESIYTSSHRNHKTALVAKSRIKWFLEENTPIYAPGDLPQLLADPHITIGDIVGDVYEIRNIIAHGDKLPDRLDAPRRNEFCNDRVSIYQVLFDAASFIIRTSLLKILRDNLLDHFANENAANAYFGAQGLTLPKIAAAIAAQP